MRVCGAYTEQDWWGPVTVDGQVLDPAASQRIVNHSPDGFAWGYEGSGPAQLALGLLLAAGYSPAEARTRYVEFMRTVVARLPAHAPFAVTIEFLTHGWGVTR